MMRRALIALLFVALATPAAAQSLRASVAPAVAADAAQYPSAKPPQPPLRNEPLFWTGLVVGAAGIVVAILAVTSEQTSDLSNEYRSVRLGVDLAPCGTDQETTLRPVAECQPNGPMLWVASGMMATSAGLIVYGGGRDYTASPTLRWRVRF
jgi:hypothetical protein